MNESRARFINTPNYLKQKVGSGGLPPEILKAAEDVIENNMIDFSSHTKELMAQLQSVLLAAKTQQAHIDYRTLAIAPTMQLKAHGGMFRQPLISEMASSALDFLENITTLDQDALKVVDAHYDALAMVSNNNISGLGGAAGEMLVKELGGVCNRYYKKHEITPTN